MAPVFDVFLVDDSLTTSAHIGGPVGDLRLYPDLDVLTPLAGQPGRARAAPAPLPPEGGAPPPRPRRLPAAPGAPAAAPGLRVPVAVPGDRVRRSGPPR